MSIPLQFLHHPRRTGAITASSAALARRLTEPLALHSARTVVELGPGTGAVTGAIRARMHPDARLIAVELNPVLAQAVRERFAGPDVDVHTASAADLVDLVDGPVDAVVSGLPWAAMRADERTAALDAVTAVLRPDGAFTTFAYIHAAWSPPARRLAADLRARFAEVHRSPVVWTNTPPAFVHHAVNPKAGRP
ncbi:class I SAM-dependent methyltransferase [Yinghuangia seranimata]|uniref:class I SAM-dependent methyltransferase n=1 Tax=Yinghuangia seranimata TaxID=408067 RepID=UPI00248B52E7|nr:methyltransferase domain-containing protein [Yinghuangia seranimata]MDI2125480.1 methyltransferase domain-containing protein [Yinghuangia seranimata]